MQLKTNIHPPSQKKTADRTARNLNEDPIFKMYYYYSVKNNNNTKMRLAGFLFVLAHGKTFYVLFSVPVSSKRSVYPKRQFLFTLRGFSKLTLRYMKSINN